MTFVRPQQPIQQFDTSNGYPVPGLGFDYSDLAAFERGERVTHFRDFDRGHNRPEFFTPILFGGYPYYWDMLDMPRIMRRSQLHSSSRKSSSCSSPRPW